MFHEHFIPTNINIVYIMLRTCMRQKVPVHENLIREILSNSLSAKVYTLEIYTCYTV